MDIETKARADIAQCALGGPASIYAVVLHPDSSVTVHGRCGLCDTIRNAYASPGIDTEITGKCGLSGIFSNQKQ